MSVPGQNPGTCADDWLRSLTILHRGHWETARNFDRLNLTFGILATVAAAIAGTTAFAQLAEQVNESPSLLLQIAICVAAGVAASLSALQTFFRSSERAEKHKQSAVKFGQLRRELAQAIDCGLPTDHDKLSAVLTSIRKRWDAVDDEALPVPSRIYDRMKREALNAHE